MPSSVLSTLYLLEHINLYHSPCKDHTVMPPLDEETDSQGS